LEKNNHHLYRHPDVGGRVFATSIILMLIPCLYMILEDLKSHFGNTQMHGDTA